MPRAAFKSVREVSSEDDVHVAANLFHQQAGKKWKTKMPGEKSAYVILELEESMRITRIDIGNEHSAFVEVLVGKANCPSKDFTEILITSSFMTPIESKNSTNTNRVRCFGPDALVASACEQKWKMVKFVCTQPFNKFVQYGLSFVNIHCSDNCVKRDEADCIDSNKVVHRDSKLERNSSVQEPSGVFNKNGSSLGFGMFSLRSDSPDSESESSGGMFNRWKMARNQTPEATLSTKAPYRKELSEIVLHEQKNIQKPATTIASKELARNVKNPEVSDRNRDTSSLPHKRHREEASQECDNKKIRTGKEISCGEKDKLRTERSAGKDKPANKIDRKAKPEKLEQDTIAGKLALPSDLAKASQDELPSSAKKVVKHQNIQYKPFNELLKGVVLVISGIQNPDRADLRSKALAMGAKYKADWENGCTHLICAFKNTPKYQKVSGEGKIVTRNWIDRCYATKKYLPWRRFALDSEESEKPESDEEILDEASKQAVSSSANQTIGSVTQNDGDLDMNTYSLVENKDSRNQIIMSERAIDNANSGSDTDDEIQRALGAENFQDDRVNNSNGIENIKENVFEASTDEEDFLEARKK